MSVNPTSSPTRFTVALNSPFGALSSLLTSTSLNNLSIFKREYHQDLLNLLAHSPPFVLLSQPYS
uniref:Uncharacterized protein n=1 Tax=uncultured marine virus TaxID=186617 RepID=A0A0F7LA52_9VIRU|nr:hypothetical protein [uncultured marine virus]